jgi:hypothetical protein
MDAEEPDTAKGVKDDHVDKVTGHAETGETTTRSRSERHRELDHRDEAI